LQDLLELALRVPGRARAEVGAEGVLDEPPRDLEPAVEVEGRDHRLEGVRPKSALPPAPGLLLAASQNELEGKAQALGPGSEARRRHEVGPGLALQAFVPVGIPPMEEVRDHEPEDRVPEELEGLVVPDLSRGILVRAARVGEGLVEDLEIDEVVAEEYLQGSQPLLALGAHASCTTRPPTTVRSMGAERISRG
jgi:hypothetical protein